MKYKLHCRVWMRARDAKLFEVLMYPVCNMRCLNKNQMLYYWDLPKEYVDLGPL